MRTARPGAAQRAAGARADQLDVEFGVIEMDDLKGAVAVPGGGQIERGIEWLVDVRRTGALAFAGLVIARTGVDGTGKGFVARGEHAALGTRVQQGRIDGAFVLLRGGFILLHDMLHHQRARRLRQFGLAIATLPGARQEADIAVAVEPLRLAIRVPTSDRPCALAA